MIHEITREEVIDGCRQALGLPHEGNGLIEDTLLAALLRRAGGILCPCSRTALRAALLESLQMLADDADSLAERIDAVIEGLIIGGDLLELQDVATADQMAKGSWVFAAPPCFVVRPGGSLFLTGTVPDQDTYLPPSLASRVQYEGVTRVLSKGPNEDLAGALRELGLQELPESLWLKSPKQETAESLLAGYQQQLEMQPPSGTVADIVILDPTLSVRFYLKRWISPSKHHNGAFIAKRPQEFGSPIWCFALLSDGQVVKFLDLPPKRTRWRGSDVAWHLQMAVDHCRGAPQLYRRTRSVNDTRLDFFSPLPQWSQRRLMIFGHSVPRMNCLMSFVLPQAQVQAEEEFLQQRLWLASTEGSM